MTDDNHFFLPLAYGFEDQVRGIVGRQAGNRFLDRQFGTKGVRQVAGGFPGPDLVGMNDAGHIVPGAGHEHGQPLSINDALFA